MVNQNIVDIFVTNTKQFNIYYCLLIFYELTLRKFGVLSALISCDCERKETTFFLLHIA